MNIRKLAQIWSAALVGFIAVLVAATPARAQQLSSHTRHTRYQVIDVGTFGGPTSSYNSGSVIINGRGTVVGAADTSIFDAACGCFVFHAFRWENGVLTDLGTLPGGSDSVAATINSAGSIVGLATNGVIDPLTGPQFDAVLWKDGQIIDLGNLGGSFAVAIDISNRGQIVGGGLNTTFDPFGGVYPFLGGTTQTRALLWQNGSMRDLGTLGGNDAFAEFVNERGQIVGNSVYEFCPKS